MATKNNRRTLLTKRILKETLLELMQTKPISKITIKEICDRSDMSRSTFYLHYQDQFDLLSEIEKEVLEKTFENLSKLDNKLNAIESIELFLNYVKDNKETFGVLLCQHENLSFQHGILSSVQNYIQSLVPLLITSSKEPYIYSFMMHGCISIITDWINRDFDISSKELAEVIYDSCNNIARSNQI